MYMILLLWLVSVTAFVVIQLPPGDFVDSLAADMEMYQNVKLSPDQLTQMRQMYGLDKPLYVQYLAWMGRLITGDMGISICQQRPVAQLLAERVPLTIVVSLATMFFCYAISIPVAIYSATHQYTVGDYIASVIGFVGMATPPFLLALVLVFIGFKFFGFVSSGLIPTEYLDMPWSMAKTTGFLKHLIMPAFVIGITGTAGLIRTLRACILDELEKPYVVTARAKGLSETKLLFKYPVRIAMIPIISTIGWALAAIVSGETVISIVLNLPTTGPLLLEAIQKQDMYLAGSILMFLSSLTIIGTFISDILLVIVDPRIRL